MQHAPVVLFVYNRPNHTRETLDALKNNRGADETDLIIYSDAASRDSDIDDVSEVRSIARSAQGFRSITVYERATNWGLAQSIVDGVTEVINEFDRAIILEDDIITSPAFLSFMNYALEVYKLDRRIWHISGWSYPNLDSRLGDIFIWRVMNCWGWATWADRWQHFSKDPKRLVRDWSCEEKRKFDLDGSGVFWPQVKANINGKINTWAIFWYSTIFENHGLCLNPNSSYTKNIGHDGSGTNCGNSKDTDSIELNMQLKPKLVSNIEEDPRAVETIKRYYKSLRRPIFLRALNKIAKIILKRKIF